MEVQLHQAEHGQQVEGGDPSLLRIQETRLEFWVLSWAAQYKRDMDIPEQGQRRVMKVVKGLEHLRYKKRLLFSLE